MSTEYVCATYSVTIGTVRGWTSTKRTSAGGRAVGPFGASAALPLSRSQPTVAKTPNTRPINGAAPMTRTRSRPVMTRQYIRNAARQRRWRRNMAFCAVASPDAPVLQGVYLVLLAAFLVGVTLQVRWLR